jgi:2OG-Fe(II) oxygenase superfamily
MEKIFLNENVYYIDDFISDESIEILHNICLNKEGWESLDPALSQKTVMSFSDENALKAFEEFYSKAKLLFNTDDRKFEAWPSIQKYRSFDPLRNDDEHAMGPHQDNPGYVKALNLDQDDYISMAGILYLNEDFDGGETFYPEYNFEIKPKKNRLAVHYGDPIHGIKQVYNGNRYALNGFLFKK